MDACSNFSYSGKAKSIPCTADRCKRKLQTYVEKCVTRLFVPPRVQVAYSTRQVGRIAVFGLGVRVVHRNTVVVATMSPTSAPRDNRVSTESYTHASTAWMKEEYIFNQIVWVFSSSSDQPYKLEMTCFPKCLKTRSQSENPEVTPWLALDLLPNQTSTAELDGELLALFQSSSADLGRRVRESTVTENFVELSLVVVVSVTSRVIDSTDVNHNVQRVHCER